MIVFDTSAVIEIVRQSDDGIALQQLARKNEKKISCDLIRAEAASALRKLSHLEGFDSMQAETYLSEAMALIDEFSPMEELQTEALREAIRLDHSVYDMFYFVLARRTGAILFTLDRKLEQLCLDNGVNVIAQVAI